MEPTQSEAPSALSGSTRGVGRKRKQAEQAEQAEGAASEQPSTTEASDDGNPRKRRRSEESSETPAEASSLSLTEQSSATRVAPNARSRKQATSKKPNRRVAAEHAVEEHTEAEPMSVASSCECTEEQQPSLPAEQASVPPAEEANVQLEGVPLEPVQPEPQAEANVEAVDGEEGVEPQPLSNDESRDVQGLDTNKVAAHELASPRKASVSKAHEKEHKLQQETLVASNATSSPECSLPIARKDRDASEARRVEPLREEAVASAVASAGAGERGIGAVASTPSTPPQQSLAHQEVASPFSMNDVGFLPVRVAPDTRHLSTGSNGSLGGDASGSGAPQQRSGDARTMAAAMAVLHATKSRPGSLAMANALRTSVASTSGTDSPSESQSSNDNNKAGGSRLREIMQRQRGEVADKRDSSLGGLPVLGIANGTEGRKSSNGASALQAVSAVREKYNQLMEKRRSTALLAGSNANVPASSVAVAAAAAVAASGRTTPTSVGGATPTAAQSSVEIDLSLLDATPEKPSVTQAQSGSSTNVAAPASAAPAVITKIVAGAQVVVKRDALTQSRELQVKENRARLEQRRLEQENLKREREQKREQQRLQQQEENRRKALERKQQREEIERLRQMRLKAIEEESRKKLVRECISTIADLLSVTDRHRCAD